MREVEIPDAAVRAPAGPPLHWNVQQRQVPQLDGSLAWGEPQRFPQSSCTAAEAFAGLWSRRKDANRTRIPGGLECDDWDMCPVTERRVRVRTRVTFETPEGVAFDV